MADKSPFKGFNPNSNAVRRLMAEFKELSKETSSLFKAQPLEDNIFEWHFTIRGPRETDFEGGIYHGRILLPPEYPYKPPDIVFLTPNGRFETDKKICLTISSHHEETWRPSWNIRTVLIAIIAFMPSKGDGALASLDWSTAERKKLAERSLAFTCPKCKSQNMIALPAEDVTEKLEAVPEELEVRDAKPKAETPVVAADPSQPLNYSTSEVPQSLANSAVVNRNPLAMSAPAGPHHSPVARASPPSPAVVPPVQPPAPAPTNQVPPAQMQPPVAVAQPPRPTVSPPRVSTAIQTIDLFLVIFTILLAWLLYKRCTEPVLTV